jgi:hypothetical protein
MISCGGGPFGHEAQTHPAGPPWKFLQFLGEFFKGI